MSAELASSLAQDDIPIKLRCATCNKLVVDAFRLPCCDQSICGNCQADLPESCPVCDHSPLSADDCKPNKALRLTVKAFLKNEEKKREKERGASTVPPSNPGAALAQFSNEDEALPAKNVQIQPQAGNDSNSTPAVDGEANEQSPIQHDSLEQVLDIASGQAAKNENEGSTGLSLEGDKVHPAATDDGDTDSLVHPNTSSGVAPANSDWNSGEDQNMLANGVGMNNMNFANNWNGSNNFMPMMAMQNGMQTGPWPTFPSMMGMSGMSMDPMMMAQGMFGGFNGQGMGMNGMNGMNMGAGFDGLYGWNGQNAMGMHGLNGDFGTSSRYHPGGGYNHQAHQGQFNGMPHQQLSMNNYQQNRSRGRGHSQRGFGRDQGFHAGRGQYAHSQNAQFNRGLGHMSQPKTSDETAALDVPQETVDDDDTQTAKRVSGTNDQDVKQQNDGVPQVEAETSGNPSESQPEDIAVEGDPSRPSDSSTNPMPNENSLPPVSGPDSGDQGNSPVLQAIETVDTTEPYDEEIRSSQLPVASTIGMDVPRGPAAQYASGHGFDGGPRGRGSLRGYGRGAYDFRGGYRGRGAGFGGSGAPIVPRVLGVAGAPTGPKAMRDGVAVSSFRGRGAAQIPNRSTTSDSKHSISKSSITDRARSRSASKSRSKSESKSRSRSRSRSKPPSKDRHRRHRQRSRSPSAGIASTTSSRHHHHGHHRSHQSRKHDDDNERQDDRDRRARESSPDHAIKRRDRRDRDHDHHSSRRSRSRSRSRSHSHHHDDDRERKRKRSRRDRSSSHEASRTSASGPSSGARNGANGAPREFKIKDRSKRSARAEFDDDDAGGASRDRGEHGVHDRGDEDNTRRRADRDSHALEREARNRERQAKEQQRRQLLYTEPGKKRGRGEGSGTSAAGGGEQRGSSRRKLKHDGYSGDEDKAGARSVGYKYRDEENDEARALRVEKEREAARWS